MDNLGKLQFKTPENQPSQETIKEELKWFIDRFVHATAKYPQQLTKYAVTSLLQDIYSRKENITETTDEVLQKESYGFKEYKYLHEQTLKVYEAHAHRFNLKIPESISNDTSNEDTFRNVRLYTTFIGRIQHCIEDILKIQEINRKEQLTDKEILEILKIINSSHDNKLVTMYKEKESQNSHSSNQSIQNQLETKQKVSLADNAAKEEIRNKIWEFSKDFPPEKRVVIKNILDMSLEGI